MDERDIEIKNKGQEGTKYKGEWWHRGGGEDKDSILRREWVME